MLFEGHAGNFELFLIPFVLFEFFLNTFLPFFACGDGGSRGGGIVGDAVALLVVVVVVVVIIIITIVVVMVMIGRGGSSSSLWTFRVGFNGNNGIGTRGSKTVFGGCGGDGGGGRDAAVIVCFC